MTTGIKMSVGLPDMMTNNWHEAAMMLLLASTPALLGTYCV